MEKASEASLFANDGSFMERFKQIQEEKEKKSDVLDKSQSGSNTLVSSTPKTVIRKATIDFKASSSQKTIQAPSSGKLVFSLKQRSKLATPAIKFEEDEQEHDTDTGNSSDDGSMKRRKLGQFDVADQSSKLDVVPPFPSDPTVKKVADKLASFVAKNGRQFEHVTRQKNPGDTPFQFLFDENCSDYKYYEYRLREEEKVLGRTGDSQTSQNGTTLANSASSSQRSQFQHSKYQTPTPASYETTENRGTAHSSSQTTMGESSGPSESDPIAMTEYYMKKAAEEEKLRHPKPSKEEMPPPPSLLAPVKGHHMGDYIPPEELEKFLAACNDAASQKAAKEYADKCKIQADNVGHRLLSKMGWKEGEGLGSSKSGIAAPVIAGGVKKDNLGVGAHAPGEVLPDDDIYEQYKKRMMLGYRYRPNPLNNPRKAYY